MEFTDLHSREQSGILKVPRGAPRVRRTNPRRICGDLIGVNSRNLFKSFLFANLKLEPEHSFPYKLHSVKPSLRVPARACLHTTPLPIPVACAYLLGCLLLLVGVPVVSAYDALYAFGDSLTDTGNNPAPAGTNYYNGHFSNGPLWVEYMSTNLGLAYVQTNNHADSGSETAGALLAVQNFPPPVDAATAVFAVWSGGNDFIKNVSVTSQQNDPLWAGVISNAVYNLTNAVAVLYADGARTIIVPNLPDLSKLPAANPLTSSYKTYISGKIGLYNANLLQALNKIRSGHPNLDLSGPDIFTNFNNILANPAAYGFTKTTVGALED